MQQKRYKQILHNSKIDCIGINKNEKKISS